jgi:hypothetical protein
MADVLRDASGAVQEPRDQPALMFAFKGFGRDYLCPPGR